MLIDTSTLVRLRDADSALHSACVEAVDRLQDGPRLPCICAQVMIEYWAVATRPREANGLGLAPFQAMEDLDGFLRIFTLLPEPPDMADRWRALASAHSVRGRQARDARLAALMAAHGITELLTLKPADLARYPHVTSLGPEDI